MWSSPSSEQKISLHSQLLPDWERRVCKGGLACVYQLLEASGGLCPMSYAEVLYDTLLWAGLCKVHFLLGQLAASNEGWSDRDGLQVPGEIFFKAVTEMLLMRRRCCSLDPINLHCSQLSLPHPWGVINLLRDDPPADQRSPKGGRRTAGKIRKDNVKPAEKSQLCKSTNSVNAFGMGKSIPGAAALPPKRHRGSRRQDESTQWEQPFSGHVS